MAVAVIKLEILSAAPNNEVSIMGSQPVLNMKNVTSEYQPVSLLPSLKEKIGEGGCKTD